MNFNNPGIPARAHQLPTPRLCRNSWVFVSWDLGLLISCSALYSNTSRLSPFFVVSLCELTSVSRSQHYKFGHCGSVSHYTWFCRNDIQHWLSLDIEEIRKQEPSPDVCVFCAHAGALLSAESRVERPTKLALGTWPTKLAAQLVTSIHHTDLSPFCR